MYRENGDLRETRGTERTDVGERRYMEGERGAFDDFGVSVLISECNTQTSEQAIVRDTLGQTTRATPLSLSLSLGWLWQHITAAWGVSYGDLHPGLGPPQRVLQPGLVSSHTLIRQPWSRSDPKSVTSWSGFTPCTITSALVYIHPKECYILIYVSHKQCCILVLRQPWSSSWSRSIPNSVTSWSRSISNNVTSWSRSAPNNVTSWSRSVLNGVTSWSRSAPCTVTSALIHHLNLPHCSTSTLENVMPCSKVHLLTVSHTGSCSSSTTT